MQSHMEEIQQLPECLAGKIGALTDLLDDSKATNTVLKYSRGFMKWKRWALAHDISNRDILPAKALHVALYLTGIIQDANSPSPVISAFYSIKWAHDMADLSSPTNSSIVKNMLESGKRKLAKPVGKKEPITVEHLTKMYYSLHSADNLYNQRTICACLLGFAGFLRSNELLNLRRSDFQILTTHMSIFIQKSKADIYRDGSWVQVARTLTDLCPVKITEKYFTLAGFDVDSDEFIFRKLSKCKNGYHFRCNKPLSYTRMRELFIEAFKPFVDDISSYGLHSLRSGGATACANLGINDRLFKRHGRWKSEFAKDGYIKDNLSERLIVSQNLGI
ncbi:hypothetical protein SNE40_023749 [Patella caerulea]|uniref:Tyr recombinase domain-containing protein n=1 Tax=Patella caerulea TaxID=87958 RepID=A0AAN8FZF7_PATCE